MDKILITDGNTRSALAATRSLGKRGLHVVVGGDTKRTLSGASRFCRGTITYPSPDQDPEGFIAAIRSECLARSISVIFPMTEISTSTVLRRRERSGLEIDRAHVIRHFRRMPEPLDRRSRVAGRQNR